MPTQERLFILPVYSIENLVLLESAILEVATDGLVDSSIARARDTLGPAKLLESVSRALLPLFAVYGIAHSLKLPIETVSFPVQRLCDDGNDISTLSGKRIRTRMRQVLAEVANRVDLDLYRSEADRVKQILRVATDTQRYISGKSYLLPSIHIHLRKHAAFRGSQDELKARLARHYEPETEPGLSARIRGLLSESEAA